MGAFGERESQDQSTYSTIKVFCTYEIWTVCFTRSSLFWGNPYFRDCCLLKTNKLKKQSLLWSDTGAERMHYMKYLPLSLPPSPPPLPSPTRHPQPKQFRNRLRAFSGWSTAITIFWSDNGVSRSAHQGTKRLKTRLTCSLINLTRIRPLNVRAASKLNCS